MSDVNIKTSPSNRTLIVWQKHGFKLLSIALALIALITALIIHSNADEALAISKGSFQQQQNINVEAAQSAALLNEYLNPYRVLQEQGIISPPERLQWLETLQASVNNNLVPKMNFVLSPTAQADATNTTYMHETLAVKVTPMRVDFTLLHEGDLYHLLEDMKAQSKGLYSAENCEIKRSEEESINPKAITQFTYSKAGFKGYCNLIWYSLADITSAWEVPREP